MSSIGTTIDIGDTRQLWIDAVAVEGSLPDSAVFTYWRQGAGAETQVTAAGAPHPTIANRWVYTPPAFTVAGTYFWKARTYVGADLIESTPDNRINVPASLLPDPLANP